MKRTREDAKAGVLEPIRYSRGKLELLDQKLLPSKFVYLSIADSKGGWEAIHEMNVRGAPAIAIAAALSLAVECELSESAKSLKTATEALVWLRERLEYLKTARPTAVNLMNDCDRLSHYVGGHAATMQSGKDVLTCYVEEAEKMLAKDIADNHQIGNFGAEAILSRTSDSQVRVLTHCNAGSLATAQYGTAVGIIRSLHSQGKLEHAFCTETRPYNQGCRLTAFELVHEGMPGTLICDSMAASLMDTRGLHGVVVGADRVVANGDTANKIGTYQLAIAAAYHKIPFFVAVPFTTVDLALATGKDIVIEERKAEELTHINGVRIAADGIGVWNPAFDVTPANLITGLVTEHGVIYKKEGAEVFDVRSFVEQHTKK